MAFAAAAALLNFSSQEIVHAAAAFEVAFDFTSFRSLFTGPAAFAQAYLATMKIWHAAAAPAAAVKGFFHHDLLAEPAAASEYEVEDLIQPAVAASAAAKGNDGCLSDHANHVFEMVLRLIWSLVGASGVCEIDDSGFGAVLSSVLRAVPGKDMPLSLGKGKKQSFINGLSEAEELKILQASILEARSVAPVEFDMIKGKDRHDFDGSLSLGKGEASGRVDVPVGVTKLIDQALRSPQSVVRRSAGLDSLSPSLPLALAS